MAPLAIKTCTKCGETKTVLEFPRDRTGTDGFNSWCKACLNAHTAALNRRKRADARRAKQA